MNNHRIGLIGGGSWATAIAQILTNNHLKVNWWIREPEIIEGLKKYNRNTQYLGSVEFDMKRLFISSSIKDIFKRSDIVVLCVPAAFLTDALKELQPKDFTGKIIVSAIKGIVPEHNMVVADYMNGIFNVPIENLVVVSGPSHAEEVAEEKLTYLTVASKNNEIAETVADLFANRYIKTSTSEDIYGIEYGSVLKNIYAVAVGISKGLGYGDNFRAVLIANAMQEMNQFLEVLHTIDRDINQSVYLGDLLVTCYSQFSRNRTFGTMIGAGYTVKSAQLEMNMIAEGYYASKCMMTIKSQFHVEMPIAEAVYNILYEKISPAIEMRILSDKMN